MFKNNRFRALSRKTADDYWLKLYQSSCFSKNAVRNLLPGFRVPSWKLAVGGQPEIVEKLRQLPTTTWHCYAGLGAMRPLNVDSALCQIFQSTRSCSNLCRLSSGENGILLPFGVDGVSSVLGPNEHHLAINKQKFQLWPLSPPRCIALQVVAKSSIVSPWLCDVVFQTWGCYDVYHGAIAHWCFDAKTRNSNTTNAFGGCKIHFVTLAFALHSCIWCKIVHNIVNVIIETTHQVALGVDFIMLI